MERQSIGSPAQSPSPDVIRHPPGIRRLVHPAARLTSAADPTPSARCSSRRAPPAAPVVAHLQGRAAPDGRPRARRVGPGVACDASRDSASRGPRRGPPLSASPAVATLTSVAPDGRVSAGSGSRSPVVRSGRSDARSSWASRRRRCGGRSPGRRRRVSEPSSVFADHPGGSDHAACKLWTRRPAKRMMSTLPSCDVPLLCTPTTRTGGGRSFRCGSI